MQLETNNKSIPASNVKVYEFLNDIKNFEKLMPDSMETFEVLDEETFKFSLSGMPTIVLKKKKAYLILKLY